MTPDLIWHDSFYRFVPLDDPSAVLTALEPLCVEAGVLGTVLVAPEGVNGMLAGSAAGLARVRAFFDDDPRLSGMVYKRTACSAPPFARLKLRVRPELVPLGLPGVDATQTGELLSPQEWRALLDDPEVVLLDVRNGFEYRLGHFRGALNPELKSFADFADYALRQMPAWRGKRVAMYCTGGIRCEKASAWLRREGLEVAQLKGGVLNYFAQVPGADADFVGPCFVFDARVALDAELAETGLRREDDLSLAEMQG